MNLAFWRHPMPCGLSTYLDRARELQAQGLSMHAAALDIVAIDANGLTVRTVTSMIGDWVQAGRIPPFQHRKGRPRGTRNKLPLEREAGVRVLTGN